MNTKNEHAIRNKPEQIRSKNRVREIMDAAKGLITEGGIDSFTMKDIAVRAGMKSTALYRYFPNKQAVVRELTLQMFKEDNERVTQTMLSSDATAEQIMREGSYRYWKLHEEEPYRIKLNLAIQSDQELWKLSVEDSKKNVKDLCNMLVANLAQKDIEVLERKALLNVVLMASAINLVSSLNKKEADLIMKEFINMSVNNMMKQ